MFPGSTFQEAIRLEEIGIKTDYFHSLFFSEECFINSDDLESIQITHLLFLFPSLSSANVKKGELEQGTSFLQEGKWLVVLGSSLKFINQEGRADCETTCIPLPPPCALPPAIPNKVTEMRYDCLAPSV